jgi:hypothetical protein
LAEAAKTYTSETLSEEIDSLSNEIEALRAAYEQFFLGIERHPPSLRHDKLKKAVVAIQMTTVKQTAVKFKAQSLNAKLITYERLWTRTMHEIEDGTYKRDVFKAKLHRKEHEEKDKEKAPEKAAVAPSPQVAAAAAPKPAATAGPQLSESKLRAIYDAYLTAKKRCNEDVSKLTYESVASTLKQQVPALIKQHNAKSVEFKVVIKDGKAVLRALPK